MRAVYFRHSISYKSKVPGFYAVGELMVSKRLLVLTVSALFLVIVIVRSLTTIGDSQSAPERFSAGESVRDGGPGPGRAGEGDGSTTSPAPPTGSGSSIDQNSGEVKASLPLFRSVGAAYLRGATPARGGLDLLARFGVKSLVDLRSKYDRTPDLADDAQRAGLQYYWLPLSVWDPPTDAQTAEFLGLVMDASRGPVFVFCADGVNRTGEMTAIYRIIHDRWSTDQAIKEMDDAGFSPYYYSLRNYVWAYARTHKPAFRNAGQN